MVSLDGMDGREENEVFRHVHIVAFTPPDISSQAIRHEISNLLPVSHTISVFFAPERIDIEINIIHHEKHSSKRFDVSSLEDVFDENFSIHEDTIIR